MSDSDSDSDVPLALLAAKKKKAAAAAAPPPEEDESSEAEFDDGDDDDDDDFEEDGDDDEEEEEIDAKYYSSDSSDDVPLSKLKSPKKKKAASSAAAKAAKKSPAKKKAASSAKKKAPAKKAPAKKTTKAKAKKKTAAKKSSGKKSPVPSGGSSSSRPNLPSFALYDHELDKGLLIQRFLCRWWYAVEWPDPATLPPSPPAGYDALNGFPGVYICTKGASIGRIVDRRDKSTAPSFANYARKSSEELQGLLLKALAKQKAQLVEAEGSGTDAEKELDKMEKWTRKLNCKKLDKDAATALKAAGISLD